MPLLEIANAQPSFQNPLCSLGLPKPLHGKLASVSFKFSNEQILPCAWKSLSKFKRVKFGMGLLVVQRDRLLVKAVATLEPRSLAADEDKRIVSKGLDRVLNSNPPGSQHKSSNEKSIELDERENLRRMRISKANKGLTPWNKGKKHSAETLQKIKERTWLAMQDPKVKMKLINFGHAQTEETKLKIAAGVKMKWERKRKKQMAQETCCFEWQNLIAEAARLGYVGEEELQWDSYETFTAQLKQEWQESVAERKRMPRPHGSKRAPKSVEQRRKIAEAISAKWADPDYRERVCSALAKYHGIEHGAERRPRRRPSDGTQPKRRNHTKKMASATNMPVKRLLKKSKSPVYKDPFVSYKLEMIKNIRAQRASTETKQAEAIERARLLIAEAEKAAKALEIAAKESPIAQASLIETRKLIAEAIQSLASIEGISESNPPSVALTEIERETNAASEVPNPNHSDIGQVNGHKASSSSSSNDYKISIEFGKFALQKLLNGNQELHHNGNQELHQMTANGCASYPLGFDSQREESSSTNQTREKERDQSIQSQTDPPPNLVGMMSTRDETLSRSVAVTKKWVRGRLVDVGEDTQ